jgi:hypothetical protein
LGAESGWESAKSSCPSLRLAVSHIAERGDSKASGLQEFGFFTHNKDWTRRARGDAGGVATGLQRSFTAEQKASLDAAEASGVFEYKTVGQGAATTIVAAVRPEFAHTGGHYLDDAQEAYTVPNDASLSDHPHGVKRWALDPEIAERLWTASTELIRT